MWATYTAPVTTFAYPQKNKITSSVVRFVSYTSTAVYLKWLLHSRDFFSNYNMVLLKMPLLDLLIFGESKSVELFNHFVHNLQTGRVTVSIQCSILL